MLKNWKKKLIAMFLIFTLTFSDFALVGKTYAASIFDGIFGSDETGDTGSANVEFDAYFFDAENSDSESIKSDIKNDNLMMKFTVKVKDSGYLKDAKILIGNGETLNFKMSTDEVVANEAVESLEDNTLALTQQNAGSEVTVTVPIYYESQKYVDIANVSKTNTMRFVGTYVNDEAKEIELSKDINLKLSWVDERDVTLNSEVTKYIGFSQDGVSGIILQTLIQADNTTSEKSLPVKDSAVKVEVPVIDGIKPTTVNVVANQTMGTNGSKSSESDFNDLWSYEYNSETNELLITASNKAKLVSTQNENDILIDETIPEEERFYSSSGIDEYLVTYIYNNVEMNAREISSKLNVNFNMYGDNVLATESEATYEVSDQIGDIVTYSVESSTESVSKGYTYLNYNNEENKYEIEIDNKIIFNVSYNDIVENLYYVDNGNSYITKDGEVLEQNDIYYKTLKVSKENFETMLGEDGYINIYNSNGELVFTVNKDVEATDDGNYNIKFDSEVKSLKFETSKPVSDGNLIFSVVKAYSNVSYDKEAYKNFDRLTINTVGKVKYIYLNDLADCGNSNLEVKLEDTKTEAELEVGQSSLSTLAMNNNVELKIELNNESIDSDVYGESEFEIKMPEYVETVEVTDTSIVYGEGLELSDVSAYENDGRIYLKVQTSGMQNALSSGIISNGTNIVLNANIKVNLFAPATEEKFELTYTNSEATNYLDENTEVGYAETAVTYSAPSGVVSVNSTYGYNQSGTTITSVNQGKVSDEIAIYSDSKTATMELTVMNNESNPISNIAILGRVPFEGVKDILTDEDLGTTVTAKMVTGIKSDVINNDSFTVFYSTNGEATADLDNEANEWTVTPANLAEVKSYLIVPKDSNFTMDVASKIRFTYDYEIPANLEHNQEIYGTFATYYTNTTSVATLDEVSVADIVGLSTGEGPQFDYETIVNKTNMNEFEELEITTTVKNTGKVTAKNVVVEAPIPVGTSYKSASSDNEKAGYTVNDSKVIFELPELESDDTVIFTLIVEADDVFANDDNEVIETEVYTTLEATDLDVTLKSEVSKVKINQAELRLVIESTVVDPIITKGTDVTLWVRFENLTSEEVKNAVATLKVDEAFDFLSASVTGYDEDGVTLIDVKDASYDENTRTIKWNVDSIASLGIVTLKAKLDVKELEGNETTKDVTLTATGKADGTATYTSAANKLTIGKPVLTIKQTTSTTNTYVKAGETINYQFVVTNEGSVVAQSVRLIDNIPDGLVVKKISYVSEGIAVEQAVSEKDLVTIGAAIAPGESLDVNIEAVATSLNGIQERSVTNSGTVNATNVQEIESNKITHIVEASENTATSTGESSTGIASSDTDITMSSISKTYKITGTAWLDENENGMRDDGEELMKGITATLVDSDGGVIKQTTSTNSKGEYTFTGVKNGNYIIIFDYDTVLYTVTVYQKENVTSNVNSDVITTKIEQDGVLRNGAVTDVITIADGSISNIDIGLINAMKFDLSLNMGISKITVQNSKGTNTVSYDNAKLTKTEIGAKQMAGSVIYIEYTFTVKNEGEIAGYAKKIVDYVPSDMNFNSGMNSDWYTGTDGNLYTSQLSTIEIQPGETKTFKLVLSRTMTDDNTGTVSNTAEIAEDYNIYGVSDIDSTPLNKVQSEDDFSRADSYLAVKTGEVFIYISVIITTILLIGVAVFIIVLKFKYRLNKGGV
jgi:uncharacterized repeat protein (TIGR01451 family)